MFGFQRAKAPTGWIACAPQGSQAVFALVEQSAGQRPAIRWTQVETWRQPARSLNKLKRSRAMKQHQRVAVLTRRQYQCLTLDAPPDVPREDWPQAVRWHLSEAVDFAIDAATVDVLAVPDNTSYRGTPQVIAVACPEREIRRVMGLGYEAGMPWTAVDIAETALRNLSLLAAPPTGAQALLHCDARHATLVVTSQGELLSARQMDLALLDVAQHSPESRQSAYDQAGLELQRTLDGIERAYGQVTLARLLVTPMPGQEQLCAHLRPLLYVPVEPLAVAEILDFSAVPQLLDDPVRLNRCLLAVGAALRDQ